MRQSAGMLPVDELRDLWLAMRDLPRDAPDTMSRKNFIPATLVVANGRLTGILDAGRFGPADPSFDLVAAWPLLDRDARNLLRERFCSSELKWARGAAWAYAQAIGLVRHYEKSNPTMAELGRSTLQRLLQEHRMRSLLK